MTYGVYAHTDRTYFALVSLAWSKYPHNYHPQLIFSFRKDEKETVMDFISIDGQNSEVSTFRWNQSKLRNPGNEKLKKKFV